MNRGLRSIKAFRYQLYLVLIAKDKGGIYDEQGIEIAYKTSIADRGSYINGHIIRAK